MPHPTQFALFFAAAFLLAITPGFISVALNTLADVMVVRAASRFRESAQAQPNLIRRMREASGGAMIALGVGLVLTRHPAT